LKNNDYFSFFNEGNIFFHLLRSIILRFSIRFTSLLFHSRMCFDNRILFHCPTMNSIVVHLFTHFKSIRYPFNVPNDIQCARRMKELISSFEYVHETFFWNQICFQRFIFLTKNNLFLFCIEFICSPICFDVVAHQL